MRDGSDTLARNLGLFDGIEPLRVFGHTSTSDDVNFRTLWPHPTTAVYPWQDSAGDLEVVSGSTNDALGGSGMQLSRVDVLDGNWERFTVTIPMAGTTPVDVAALMPDESTKTVRRVMCERWALMGTQRGTNDGDITFRRSAGAVLGYIEAGKSLGRTSVISSAIDEKLYIPKSILYIQGVRHGDIKIFFNIANNITSIPNPPGPSIPGFGARIEGIEILDQVGTVEVGNGISWLELPPASDIEIMVKRSSGGGGSPTDVQMTTSAYILKV